MNKTVAIAGLGAIGLPLARALDAGVDGLRFIAVSCRDEVKARANLADFSLHLVWSTCKHWPKPTLS